MSWSWPRSRRRCGEDARAAGVLVVLGGVLAAGLEVADEGGVLGDAVEVVHGERDVELVAMAMRWRTALVLPPDAADGGDGVVDGLAGDDFARA